MNPYKTKFNVIKITVYLKSVTIRYTFHNYSVASCTSDVFQKKAETDTKTAQVTKEIEALETVVRDLQMELRKTLEEIRQIEAKMNQTQSRRMFGFLAAVVPFVGSVLKSIFETRPVRNNEKAQLFAQKSNLKSREQNIHVRLNDVQLQLANKKTEKGEVLSRSLCANGQKPRSDLS